MREHNGHRASIVRVEADGTETEVHFLYGTDANRVEEGAKAWAAYFATGNTSFIRVYQFTPDEEQAPFVGREIRAYGVDGRLLDAWQLVRKFAA